MMLCGAPGRWHLLLSRACFDARANWLLRDAGWRAAKHHRQSSDADGHYEPGQDGRVERIAIGRSLLARSDYDQSIGFNLCALCEAQRDWHFFCVGHSATD